MSRFADVFSSSSLALSICWLRHWFVGDMYSPRCLLQPPSARFVLAVLACASVMVAVSSTSVEDFDPFEVGQDLYCSGEHLFSF